MPKELAAAPAVQDALPPLPVEPPVLLSLPQDVPLSIFLEQITNPAIRAALVGSEKLPDSITPSSLLLCLTDALYRAQGIFNSENSSLDGDTITTVTGRELGPLVEKDRILQAQVFYTVGGNLFLSGDAGALIA